VIPHEVDHKRKEVSGLQYSQGLKMQNKQFILDLQRFTAISSVGVSALRRQGVGVIGRIRKYLGSLDLTVTRSLKSQEEFSGWLDRKTEYLVQNKNVKWGAARKALNLFLRDCLYSKYLCAEYGLDHLERWLEMPLDSVTATQLKKDAGRGGLPIWQGLRKLKKKDSKQFQDHASQMAATKKIARVHLDVSMFLNNR
jgi:hypothetical protein